MKGVINFALNNRFMALALAVLLLLWGAISFHSLPVEAYPDVANNYVQIITQWPGRAAEEVEQQVTIPIEIQMNGMPHLAHLRSVSLFGLSSVMLIFDDSSENDWNRQKVLERVSQVTLPAGLQPQMGTDWSPVGQIYFYHLKSTNPKYDVMDLKSIEDWTLEKQFKSVPNVVDVSSLGGVTREYQVRVDPNELVAHGLSISQVEQQLANNNVNAGGSFVESGLQQINVRAIGLFNSAQDIGQTLIMTKSGTPLRIRDIASVAQGPKIRLGQNGKAIHRADGTVLDNDDVVEGIVLLRKGANADETLTALHEKVKELNEHILPPGVRIVPFLDRSDLVHLTTHTVLHNLTEGVLLVSVILFFFLGNLRGAMIVALTIPFSLLFASICLDLNKIPANLLSLGALDFGMVVDGTVVIIENIVRHFSLTASAHKTPLERIRDAVREVLRPVFYARAIIIAVQLDGELALYAANRFFHVVRDRLGKIPKNPRHLAEFAVHRSDEFVFVLVKHRPPFFLRFEIYEIFGVEKTGRVGAVIGPSHLACRHGDFGKRSQNDAGLICNADALCRSRAWGKCPPNPNGAFIEMWEEFRANDAADHQKNGNRKRGCSHTHRYAAMLDCPTNPDAIPLPEELHDRVVPFTHAMAELRESKDRRNQDGKDQCT